MILSLEVTVFPLSQYTLRALNDTFGSSALNDGADSFDLDASLPNLARAKSPLSPDFDSDLDDDPSDPDSDGDALDPSPFDSDEGDALDKNPLSLEELQEEEEKAFGQGDDPYTDEE